MSARCFQEERAVVLSSLDTYASMRARAVIPEYVFEYHTIDILSNTSAQ